MHIIYNLPKYIRFFFELAPFLSDTLSYEKAESTIRQRLAKRQDNFLELVKKGVFANPRSPYLKLFKLSKYTYNDVERIVKKEGLESALQNFRADGIFLSVEEFKGRAPTKRKEKQFIFKDSDFNNPLISSYYTLQSGGSRSRGTSVEMNLSALSARAAYFPLMIKMHELENSLIGMWFPAPPLGAGLMPFLQFAKGGKFISKWFTPTQLRFVRGIGLKIMAEIVGSLNKRFPYPEYASIDEVEKVVHWIVEMKKSKGSLLFLTFPSSAVRICELAKQKNLDISNTKFWLVGEPISEAKYNVITSTLCSVIPVYAFMEAGSVGFGCQKRQSCDEVHLAKDSVVLIQHKKNIQSLGHSLDAFLFTSILPLSRKILINVENGDYGEVQKSNCDCSLSQLGLEISIRNIRSFEKLTAEGTTIFIEDLTDLLENIMPKKFGGGVLDYQIVEEEIGSKTKLNLYVSPTIKNINLEKVRQSFLAELRKKILHGHYKAELLEKAETLLVKVREPICTKAGKIFTLGTHKYSK